jgi:hypothetical protein
MISDKIIEISKTLIPQEAVESAYAEYQANPASLMSLFNQRMHFLYLLERASGDSRLKENSDLADILLEGTGIRSVGDQFEATSPDGTQKVWSVIWKKIGPNYGIEMGMRSSDGELLSGEFFD